MQASVAERTIAAAKSLTRDAGRLDLSGVVPWVYNPLQYAWAAHAQYLERYARESCRILFLGMNPGPWGMAQTGVPFGEIAVVKGWLGIDARIGKPPREHPRRPIEGLACTRSEVSGRRLWGLFRERFASADEFFVEHFVANYCPLVFMEESARNVTPDKLPQEQRGRLEAICDSHLHRLLEALAPSWLVGVGAFAEKCGRRVIQAGNFQQIRVARILHPSPASPAANRDWAGAAEKQLKDFGIWK